MKTKLLVFLLLCVMAALPAWAGPLQFSVTDIEYGFLKEGPPIEKMVVVTNSGDEVAEIANVKTS